MRSSDAFTAHGAHASVYSTGFRAALIKDLLSAQTSVFISTFILKLDPSTPSHPVTELFAMVAGRIIKKNLVAKVVLNHLPSALKRVDAGLTAACYLVDSGIEVRWNIERNIQHSKVILIDDNILYIGSHNLTKTALVNPYEMTCRINDKELVGQMKKNFMKYWDELTIKPRMDGLTWH